MKIKTLFLCHSIDIGGLEMYILRYAKWLANKHPEHELHLLCKSGKLGSLEKEYLNAGVFLHTMPLGYFNPMPYLHFYRFLNSSHYDAICDFGGDFGALTMISAYMTKIPRRIVFYRGAHIPYGTNIYKRFYRRLINRVVRIYSTHILSNSQAAFDYYYADYCVTDDRRFKIIRNGISVTSLLSRSQQDVLRSELGISSNQKMVLHVGSGRWEKNHACVLKIAKHAQDNGDNIRFYFAGSDVERYHDEMVRQLKLTNIRFLGVRRDISNLLQITDVFLFPSLSEGQPNVLLEAITSGVPFIASDIAPIRESLSPSWANRWLFPPNMPKQGYSLLVEHLNDNFRQDEQFKELVVWCKDSYNEDKRFGEFLHCLSE